MPRSQRNRRCGIGPKPLVREPDVVSKAREHTVLVQVPCPSRFRYNTKTYQDLATSVLFSKRLGNTIARNKMAEARPAGTASQRGPGLISLVKECLTKS